MYAIIEDSGKQYKVAKGEVVCVELHDIEENQETLEFDKVLFVSDNGEILVGQPYVQGAKVIAKINGEAKGPKLYPLFFRRRKNSQRRIGHRQRYLEVEIADIVKS